MSKLIKYGGMPMLLAGLLSVLISVYIFPPYSRNVNIGAFLFLYLAILIIAFIFNSSPEKKSNHKGRAMPKIKNKPKGTVKEHDEDIAGKEECNVEKTL